MFRIKICGVTSVADAQWVAAAGADAVGLNLCPSSPRCVGADQAHQIVCTLPSGVVRVGIFVNAPVAMVRATRRQLGLDWIQLHGDESPAYLRQLDDCAIVKAFRFGKRAEEVVAQYLKQCQQQDRLPEALLIDAHVPHHYGGTGQVVDWGRLAGDRPWALGLPVILAGGLTPENVSTAIATVRPNAVDTASGVESAAGKKDRDRVDRFVRRATAAFDSLGDHAESSGGRAT